MKIEPLESRIAPAAVATIDLGTLNGTNGFKLEGIDANDSSGTWLGRAGDVNGDGLDDLLLSAVGGDPDGVDSAGETYVIFGKAGGFGTSFDLTTLNGTNGFRIDGVAAGDFSGAAIHGAGDVNHDGFDDLIIGATFADPNGDAQAGSCYVVFGKASGFGASLDLSTLNGTNGFRLDGIDPDDRAGVDVSSAGDFNGDGFADVIIGAWFADSATASNVGEAYIVFGKASGFTAVIDLGALNGTTGFRLDGIDAEDNVGQSVSGIGDFNADGFDDVVISAAGGDPDGIENAGECYIVFGRAGSFTPAMSLGALNGTNGFRLDGFATFNLIGQRLSGAGDVNGDGFDDVLIGASIASPDGVMSAGETFVIFGRRGAFNPSFDLTALDGTNGFRIDGAAQNDSAGSDVAAAGDVNGDGIDDILIGAINASPQGRQLAGAAYVVFGKLRGFHATFELSALDGLNGFRIDGTDPFDATGTVSGTGDINGDGFDDILIGAGLADPGGRMNAGKTYVVYGFSDREATIAADGHSATFTDADGDRVTVKVSAGTLTQANFMLVPAGDVTDGSLLRKLDLSDAQFAGANVKITATPTALGGDGLVNVGLLDATGVNLGKVSVKGDLGDLEAGAGGATALVSLSVRTMGALGLATQAGSGDLAWHLTGDVGSMKIAGNVKDTSVNISGELGRLTIGGSLIGGDGAKSGSFAVTSGIGAVKIGRDVIAGSGDLSGNIDSSGDLASLAIRGSLIGSSGNYAFTDSNSVFHEGQIFAVGDIGPVKIGRDMIGGAGFGSAEIRSHGATTSVTVGGSMIGSTGLASGQIASEGDMGPVKIGRDVIGGSGAFTGDIHGYRAVTSILIGGSLVGGINIDGIIEVDGALGSLTIRGSVIGGGSSCGEVFGASIGRVKIGGDLQGSTGTFSGAFSVNGDIGSMTIGGAIRGGDGNESGKINVGGSLGSLSVRGSIIGGRGNYNTFNTGQVFAGGRIGAVTIGGSLRGGDDPVPADPTPLAAFSGCITGDGGLGKVKIGRDVIGGSGTSSGRILSDTTIDAVTVGGSLRGGEGFNTGEIFSSGAMGVVKIAGDVTGGSGSNSGIVFSTGTLASVTVGGSLLGGQAFQTGEILVFGNAGPVKIGRDLVGGSITGVQPNLSDSGYIACNRIESVFIGGSILAGLDDSTSGGLFKNASIRVNDDIGPITVKGSLIGRTNDNGDSPVIIQARGQNTLQPGATVDTAIASIRVGGEVRNALILGGFNSVLGQANADASIGPVKVGGNWTAASLVAGVLDSGNDGFGINDSLQTASDDPALIARIASISIKGIVTGTAIAPDHFGFVAQQIGSFKALGFAPRLTTGTDTPIELSPNTADVTIREI